MQVLSTKEADWLGVQPHGGWYVKEMSLGLPSTSASINLVSGRMAAFTSSILLGIDQCGMDAIAELSAGRGCAGAPHGVIRSPPDMVATLSSERSVVAVAD